MKIWTSVIKSFILHNLHLLTATNLVRCNWKKMNKMENVTFAEESSIHPVKSRLECPIRCASRPNCKSYGIDMKNLTCYLYNFHVYSGGEIADVAQALTYYWMLKETCPTLYTYDSNLDFCYKIYTTKADWETAMNRCIQDGGLLAIIDTDSKYGLLQSMPKHFFLGGTDQEREGTWKWFNGEDIGNWYHKQPPDSTNDCLAIHNGQGMERLRCTYTFEYICEIPLITK